jgi:hypothetical protein
MNSATVQGDNTLIEWFGLALQSPRLIRSGIPAAVSASIKGDGEPIVCTVGLTYW